MANGNGVKYTINDLNLEEQPQQSPFQLGHVLSRAWGPHTAEKQIMNANILYMRHMLCYYYPVAFLQVIHIESPDVVQDLVDN